MGVALDQSIHSLGLGLSVLKTRDPTGWCEGSLQLSSHCEDLSGWARHRGGPPCWQLIQNESQEEAGFGGHFREPALLLAPWRGAGNFPLSQRLVQEHKEQGQIGHWTFDIGLSRWGKWLFVSLPPLLTARTWGWEVGISHHRTAGGQGGVASDSCPGPKIRILVPRPRAPTEAAWKRNRHLIPEPPI